MKNRPEIGSTMWDVCENLYYDYAKSAAPLIEFVVSGGQVKGFFTGGYVTMNIAGPVANRSGVIRSYKVSDVGKRVFYTAREAALYAKELSDKHDRTWERISKDCPIRRTWEKYLNEAEGEEKK